MATKRDYYLRGAAAFVESGTTTPQQYVAGGWQARAFIDGWNEAAYQYRQLLASYNHEEAMREAYWVVTGKYHPNFPAPAQSANLAEETAVMTRNEFNFIRSQVRANGTSVLRHFKPEFAREYWRVIKSTAPYVLDPLEKRVMERARKTHPRVAIERWPLTGGNILGHLAFTEHRLEVERFWGVK